MNKSLPLVSIVIPVYNRVKLVEKAIESSLNQTYTNIEIIIGDNCSTDGTWEKIQRYAEKNENIHVFQNKNNLGPVLNWKACIEKAKGEYVKILFSDDWIDNNWIEKAVPYLSDKDVGFVYSRVQVHSGDLHFYLYELYKKDVTFETKKYIEFLLKTRGVIPVSPGCALFRTKDVKKNLHVEIENDDNLKFAKYGAGNDVLIFLFTTLDYPKVVYLYSTCSHFLGHQGSLTGSNKLNIYYLWASYFFLKTLAKQNYLSVFKAALHKDRKKYPNLYKKLDVKIDYRALFHFYFLFLKGKFIYFAKQHILGSPYKSFRKQ